MLHKLFMYESIAMFPILATAAEDNALVPVEAYASLPQIEAPEISPNGVNIAVKRVYAGTHTLFLYIQGHNQPFAYSSGDESDINWFRWASDDRLLLGMGFPKKVAHWRGYYTRTIAMDPDGTNIIGLRENQTWHRSWSGGRILSLLPDDPEHILMEIRGVAKRVNIL